MILRVALRYLFAKKSHKAVNVISVISMAGVAVATMAIVVVLSVFNGFTSLAERHLAAIDPDIRIEPVASKVLAGDSLVSVLERLDGVAAASPVVEERALMTSPAGQKPVVVKGVSHDGASAVTDMDALMLDGVFVPDNGMPDSTAAVQIAVGVAVELSLRPSPYSTADIYMPRRLGRINPANPSAAYRRLPVTVSGVFRVDQPEYDADYVFAPLDRVRAMLDYTGGEASAVEVRTADGVDATAFAAELQKRLGEGYSVLDRARQQAETFRMIAVEKWITFLMLVFILLIASFNIVSTLSLMVIEKRDNMVTLRSLGATRRMVSGIFVAEGWLITAVGGVAGTLLGVALVLLQQHFGLIKLAADPSALTIDVYPVRLMWHDVALVLVTVCVTGFAIAQISRLFTRKIN